MKHSHVGKIWLVGSALAFLCFASPHAAGQETEGAPPSGFSIKSQAITYSSASVIIDGNFLFNVQGIRAYPAERRAREIRQRIIGLAKNPSVSPDSLIIKEESNTSAILAGDKRILTVFNRDAEAGGISRDAAARAAAFKIREAIDQYRADRRPEFLRRGIFQSIGAAVLTAILLALVLWGFRKSQRWTGSRYSSRAQGLKVGSVELVQAERLKNFYTGLIGTLRLFLLLLLIYLFFDYVLSRFPWTRGAAAQLRDWVVNPLKIIGQAFLDYLPNLIFLIVLAFVTVYSLKLLRLIFNGLAQGTIKMSGFDPEWSKATFSLLRVLVIAFVLIVAYPYIPGSESDAFKGVSIFLGVLVSLGASSALSNVIAGYTMIYRRTFKEGDRVTIGDHTGIVTAMRLLTTQLETIKNEKVIVPNSLILSSNVVNYSTLAKQKGLILHTSVGIGYETPWRQVDAMLKIAADRTSGLLKDPPPFVLKTSLGDFAVSYEINAYCNETQGIARIYADLHENILEQFNEYGVQIMTPAYEGDPEKPKVPPKNQWYAAPADLFFKKDEDKKR